MRRTIPYHCALIVAMLIGITSSVYCQDTINGLKASTLDLSVPEFRRLTGDVRMAGPETHSFRLGGRDGDQIRLEGLQKAGAYEVTHPMKKSGRERWIGVNPVIEGSDLTVLSEEEQATILGHRNVHRLPYKALAGQVSRARGETPVVELLGNAIPASGRTVARRARIREQRARPA